MIDPKELRIGNFIQTNSGILIEVNGVRHDWEAMDYIIIDKSDIGYSIDELSPIPITPEWLERSGFEPIIGKDAIWFQVGKNSDSSVVVFTITGGGLNKLEGGLTLIYNGGNTIIKYVHQLQNLYFALTGQELTVKELAPTL